MTDYNQFENVTSYLEKYQNGEDVDSSELGKDAVKYEHCVEWLEKKTPEAVGDLSLIHIFPGGRYEHRETVYLYKF